VHPGDFTFEETHVPIPNTTVKLLGPMIVHTSAKVGYCREHFKSQTFGSGFFYARCSDEDPGQFSHQTFNLNLIKGQALQAARSGSDSFSNCD